MNIRDVLVEASSLYNVNLSSIQIEQFLLYKELLKEWNEKINLTAITEDEDIIRKHFIDSISIVKCNLIKNGIKIIDVGTGAGFPGIPLKIIFSQVEIVLLDSLNKRINFLNEVIDKLQLKGISTVHGRAEDFARKPGYRESFNIATARAVANMSVLSEYCLPYVKVGGYFIAMKGPSLDEELREGKNAIGTLGGKLASIFDTEIPGEEMNHKVVVVEKVNPTLEKYPRKPAQIEKKPIK